VTYTPGPPAPYGQPEQQPPAPQPPAQPPQTYWGQPPQNILGSPTGSHPTDLLFKEDASIGRLWGIPLIGWWVRWLVSIPSYIGLLLVGVVAVLLCLITWIPVLVSGRYPSWGYRWVGGSLRWGARLAAYLAFLAGSYPAFSLSDEPGQNVQVPIDTDQRINRFWGIPILGYGIRAIILIPHFVVLWVLGIVCGFLLIFVWIPVLLLGRQAELYYTIVGGTQRWWIRVAAYFLLLNDQYPPFTLGH
jgi:Domain of unknown function (DUF4389)